MQPRQTRRIRKVRPSKRISIKRLKERRNVALVTENRTLRKENTKIKEELEASKERELTLTIETELLNAKLEELKKARRRLLKERVQLKRDKGTESGKTLELSFRTRNDRMRLEGELKETKDELEAANEQLGELTKKYKKVMGDKMERVLEEKNDGPRPPVEVPKCEICFREYGEEMKRTPRILLCGHTVCFECCENCVKTNESIECPFDRTVMPLCEHGVTCIAKNYTVLQMLTQSED